MMTRKTRANPRRAPRRQRVRLGRAERRLRRATASRSSKTAPSPRLHLSRQTVGTFGAIGCYSFNEFKHIACGDGGIFVTDDERLAKRLRLATDKCYDRAPGAVRASRRSSPTTIA